MSDKGATGVRPDRLNRSRSRKRQRRPLAWAPSHVIRGLRSQVTRYTPARPSCRIPVPWWVSHDRGGERSEPPGGRRRSRRARLPTPLFLVLSEICFHAGLGPDMASERRRWR